MFNDIEIKKIEAKKLNKRQAGMLLLTIMLSVNTFLMAMTAVDASAATRFVSADAKQVQTAQRALVNTGALKPVEGVDTDIAVMAQRIVNAATAGITVKVAATTNIQIKGTTIVYGTSAGTGTVTFTLAKHRSIAVQKMSVIVPAKAITTINPTTATTPTKAANALYVSKTGSDSNAGTLDAPFKTIQKAANKAMAGATVYIEAGTYSERVTLTNSGSAGSYISFENYPGDTVIIDGSSISGYYFPLFNINGTSYINVKGLRVINSSGQGIGDITDTIDNGYINITDCSTYNTQNSGIHFWNAHNIVVDGVTTDTTNVFQTDGYHDQEAVSFVAVDGFEIKNCTIMNMYNEGIDAKFGCKNGKIDNNTIKNSLVDGYNSGVGIYIDSFETGKVSDNIEVYDNTVKNCLQGIVLACEHGGSLININVHDNTIDNCGSGSLQLAGWVDSTHYANNIIFDHNTVTNQEVGIILDNPDSDYVYVTNNTFLGSATSIPIKFSRGNTGHTVIDGNTINRVIGQTGYPTGTNYTLSKSMTASL